MDCCVSGNLTRRHHHRICKIETVATTCGVGNEADPGTRHESWILLGTARRGMQMKDVESQLAAGFHHTGGCGDQHPEQQLLSF